MMLALLVILLQPAPAVLAPTVFLREGQPAPRAGLLVDPLRLDTFDRELQACEVERDGAREAARLLRGIPEQLERSFQATVAAMRVEMERDRADRLARLVSAARPPPRPWYESPWLWTTAGIALGATAGWGVCRLTGCKR